MSAGKQNNKPIDIGQLVENARKSPETNIPLLRQGITQILQDRKKILTDIAKAQQNKPTIIGAAALDVAKQTLETNEKQFAKLATSLFGNDATITFDADNQMMLKFSNSNIKNLRKHLNESPDLVNQIPKKPTTTEIELSLGTVNKSGTDSSTPIIGVTQKILKLYEAHTEASKPVQKKPTLFQRLTRQTPKKTIEVSNPVLSIQEKTQMKAAEQRAQMVANAASTQTQKESIRQTSADAVPKIPPVTSAPTQAQPLVAATTVEQTAPIPNVSNKKPPPSPTRRTTVVAAAATLQSEPATAPASAPAVNPLPQSTKTAEQPQPTLQSPTTPLNATPAAQLRNRQAPPPPPVKPTSQVVVDATASVERQQSSPVAQRGTQAQAEKAPQNVANPAAVLNTQTTPLTPPKGPPPSGPPPQSAARPLPQTNQAVPVAPRTLLDEIRATTLKPIDKPQQTPIAAVSQSRQLSSKEALRQVLQSRRNAIRSDDEEREANEAKQPSAEVRAASPGTFQAAQKQKTEHAAETSHPSFIPGQTSASHNQQTSQAAPSGINPEAKTQLDQVKQSLNPNTEQTKETQQKIRDHLSKKHPTCTEEQVTLFNAKFDSIKTQITNNLDDKTKSTLAEGTHELVKDGAIPPYPMTSDAKELENAEMQDHLPRFVEAKDGNGNTKYNIVAPKGFSGHVFVPRVNEKQEEVGHDLIEYKNGNVHREGCLCLGAKGVGTSMMSATLQANVKPIPQLPQKRERSGSVR